MACLIIFATPSGGTSYGDNEVIAVLDADTDPGAAVRANAKGQFSFLYVTDKDVDDPDIQGLVATTLDAEGVPQYKSRYSLTNLSQTPAGRYRTYAKYTSADSDMKATYSTVLAGRVDKESR